MKRTPPPVSTASAAASIWSGVGEVKTWPGHAASSMPRPTKPACNGSWPEPPPEMRPTLPRLRSRRRTNLRSSPNATMSLCAAAKPSRLSPSSVSVPLMSFFMVVLPLFFSVVLAAGPARDQPGDARRHVAQHLLQLRVLRRVVEIRHVQRDVTEMRARPVRLLQPAGMRALIGLQEGAALRVREAAGVEDELDMARRDRHRIGRIGDLRDEAAVGAERIGQALAHARWPQVEHAQQDALIFRDPVDFVAIAVVGHDPSPNERACDRRLHQSDR